MGVIFLSSLLAVLFAYLSSRIPHKSYLFEVGFVIITIVAAIRWDYACDYVRYYESFLDDYHLSGFWEDVSLGSFKEPGWAILNHIFPPNPFGFVSLVALISIFQNFVYYQFIRENVPSAHRWFAMMIYLFSTSYWIMNMSMLRQGLTITMFVFASKFIAEKKIGPSILILLIAPTIHKTAYLLLPMLFFLFVPLKKGKRIALIFIGVFFVIFFENDVLNDIVNLAFSFEKLGGYSHYIDDSDAGSFGLGGLINLIPFFVMGYFLITKFDGFNNNFKLVLFFSLISFCLLPLQIINGAFTRITTYFSVFLIVVVPVLYGQISNKPLRFALTSLFLLMLLYQYYLFMFVTDWSSTEWRNYHTVFDLL